MMNEFTLCAFADEIADELTTQMNVMEELRIFRIEMRGVNGKSILAHTLEEVHEVKKQLDARGFRVPVIGSSIGKIGIKDNFEEHIKLFQHTLAIADILQAKQIRTFSFYIPENEDPADYREEVLFRIKTLVKMAEQADCVMLHENEKGIYGDTAERCFDLMKAIDSPFYRSAFDPANFIQCNVEPYPYAYQMLEKYIVHVHVKDALKSDHSVTPAGMGDGKIKELIQSLKKMKYSGLLSVEPHLGMFTGFMELEQNLKTPMLQTGGAEKFVMAVQALRNVIHEAE